MSYAVYDCSLLAAGACGGAGGGAGDDDGTGDEEAKRLEGEGEAAAAADIGAGEGVEPKRPRMSSTADFFGAVVAVGEVEGSMERTGVVSLDEPPKISARRSWLLWMLGWTAVGAGPEETISSPRRSA